jgi:hypothetical protein
VSDGQRRAVVTIRHDPGPWPAATAFSPPRPSSPGPASSPEAGKSLRLAVSTGEAVSAKGPCVRSTAPPAGDFAPISGHEVRQLRLALAAQDAEVDGDPGTRVSRPDDSRESHTATMH